MTVTAKHSWYRTTLLAVAATFVLGGAAAPAYAHDWNDGDGWRRHEWREHERHEWREHEWREHHPYHYYGYSYAYPSGVYIQPNYWGR